MIETYERVLPHGITLGCRASGTPGRPVLLFLHGFPEGAFVWDALLEHFAQPAQGCYRCVAPYLRGFGPSSAPAEPEAYRARHLVQDIAALITLEAGPGQPLAALVAHDWGGAVAWGLANQHPALLKTLAILNSPHPGAFLRELRHNPAQQAASAYMNFLIRPDAEALLAADDYRRLWEFFTNMGAEAAPGTPGAPNGAGWLTPAVKQQYREVWRAGLTGGCNYYRASPLRPPRVGDPAAAAITLPESMLRVEVPTLVIWAEDDSALPPSLADGLEPWVPRLELRRIPRATHWIVHEQPALVARLLQGFLLKNDSL
ncbi:alpha/beta fold hydrolase [Xylophilus sp. ASV27]|uniref:alpha/beta fold hydrolase n=1 Tax=Xylophilus sp. ASV27 TaxID=2795129 RepID=UPI0018EE0202|nr:alpha/beta fold hydrolase [Xylophilus sp. ASV27]